MNANINTWVTMLRTPGLAQTTGKLCRVDDDGDKSFCCLGVAASLTPHMQVDQPARCEDGYLCEDDYCSHHAEPVIYFDNEEDLLPPRATAWLGLIEPDQQDQYTATDLEPDWPHEVGDLLQQGPRDSDLGHYAGRHILSELTLANLNDQGFTFPQIADIIAFFSVRIP